MAVAKEIVIACEKCRALFRGDPNTAASAGWFPMARKGGKKAWRCPVHAHSSQPESMGLTTGHFMPEKARAVTEPTKTTAPETASAIADLQADVALSHKLLAGLEDALRAVAAAESLERAKVIAEDALAILEGS